MRKGGMRAGCARSQNKETPGQTYISAVSAVFTPNFYFAIWSAITYPYWGHLC